MLAEDLGVDHRLVEVAALDALQQAFHPVDDFLSPAVAQGQNEREAGVLSGGLAVNENSVVVVCRLGFCSYKKFKLF